MMKLLAFKEAVIVGIATIIIGTLTAYVIKVVMPKPEKINDWNQYHVMEISLFCTGFLAHIFFELLGLNKWYCKHGSACN